MIKFKVTKAFFDRGAITSGVDRARERVLKRFGAFVRTRARSSIRRRKGVSPPLGPPYTQTGNLKRFLSFSYDRASQSVVIGPARIGGTVDPKALPALEYGGASAIVVDGKRERARFQPRPFMGPALEAELPKLPQMWKDSIR